ncbi:short chain dehydrogenase family protein [Candidatus Endolissoclinum faulkneri L2]|uniref:Short chain dehydrogenase family protein n=1 Tax=Candidatus Endolissoclinum faulkneri L2 TaxID=1193729 RepID=K7YQ44_9PROT|nr:complex I NDUFA9 subunit family protein [Candidatus Endolissoclinum faulkneri]AFX99687.1 short chain dehydrogenase family protein [Candidatus Endolissoclinum faulkneri L2]
MDGKVVTVFGASGFIGRSVVYKLAKCGARVNSVCRNVEKAKFLKTMGAVGQITLTSVDVTSVKAIAQAIKGASIVINLIGILNEHRRNNFNAVHCAASGAIAKAAKLLGVKAMLHVSALCADEHSLSEYARSKFAGEKLVRTAFSEAIILRPSIVFGKDDSFFNKFAYMAQVLPILPLIGGGTSKFQPVYVIDLAEAIIAALNTPAAYGQTYEVGGPSVYSFRELMEIILKETNRKVLLIRIPFWFASLKALLLELTPNPILTRDQVELLKMDNIVSHDAKTINDLFIKPTPIEIIIPTYLNKYRPGGSYLFNS